ncbi:MAG: LacI family transcriptional regulator [Alteromonadaceae bacterium]|nr:MAG: LacI family transcriptional regulator [Alteromonadaceae bacterium]
MIFLSLFSLFILACEGEQAAGDASSSKPKVALIMKSLANEFFVNMAESAKSHHSKNPEIYDLIVNGIKNESDLAQQVALVDQMIAMGVNAIVICPADSKALVPALARAVNAGITVVNIDNRLDAQVLAEFGLNIPFIGPSNRDGAKKVGDFVLKNYPIGTEVAILEGIPTAYNSIERRIGFELAAEEAGAKVVALQSAQWDQTKAAQITSAILSQNPNINVIFAANDNMALGAASAINMAQLDHEIALAGFDNISAIRPLLQNGSIMATAEQYGDKFAVFGIEFAVKVLDGEPGSGDRQTPVDIVTAEGLLSERYGAEAE